MNNLKFLVFLEFKGNVGSVAKYAFNGFGTRWKGKFGGNSVSIAHFLYRKKVPIAFFIFFYRQNGSCQTKRDKRHPYKKNQIFELPQIF